MSSGLRFARALCVGALAALAPVAGAQTLQAPECDTLAAWAQELDPKHRWQLNSASDGLWLPAHFSSPQTEALFGKPVLAWSREEAKTLTKHAQRCGRKAHKAKRKAESKTFRALKNALHYRVTPTLKKMESARATLESELDALLSAPASREALLALAAVRGMGPGGAMSNKDKRRLRYEARPVGDHAVAVVNALRKLPDAAAEDVRAPVAARLDEVRGPIVAEIEQSLRAAPESLDGLKSLEIIIADTTKELRDALTERDLGSLDAAAAARRDAIEAVLLDEETAKLAAVPESLQGLDEVAAITSGASATALSEPRAAELRRSAAARRDAIEAVLLEEQIAELDSVPESLQGLDDIEAIATGARAAALSEPRAAQLHRAVATRRQAVSEAIVAQEIAKLEALPATLEGLRSLASLESGVLRRLEGGAAPVSATPFEQAARARYAELGREAITEYEAALAALPASEQGLKDLRRLAGSVRAPVERMPQSLRDEYSSRTVERRAEIAAAVEREEARLASLPLPGAVFVDSAGPRFEFRDDARVYLTLMEDVTVEGEYEVDGDRLVIRVPQGNMVMSREGVWLKGHGLELKRQPEP